VPTSRIVFGVAGATLLLTTLSGCGTSPYCQAIEDNKVALNSLGEQKTNAAYVEYARAFRAVVKVAPPGIRKDWVRLGDVTQGVVVAQRKAGISLEDMLVPEKIAKVSPDKLKILNDAYEAFNNTADERKAVVKNVKDECEIVLS
jgi:hypothetical protein